MTARDGYVLLVGISFGTWLTIAAYTLGRVSARRARAKEKR